MSGEDLRVIARPPSMPLRCGSERQGASGIWPTGPSNHEPNGLRYSSRWRSSSPGPYWYFRNRDEPRPERRAAAAGATSGAPVFARQNVIDLSAEQKSAFIAAIRKLQTTPAPDHPERTWYEQFVTWHRNGAKCSVAHGTSGAIHNSPLFLPWHRELLIKFEAALQKVSGDPTMRIPYWDFNDLASSAAVFTADFMGGMGDATQAGAVTTGAFAKGKYELRVVDPPTFTSAEPRRTSRVRSARRRSSTRVQPRRP